MLAVRCFQQGTPGSLREPVSCSRANEHEAALFLFYHTEGLPSRNDRPGKFSFSSLMKGETPMKRILLAACLLPLCLCLASCGQSRRVLTGIRFVRGNSMVMDNGFLFIEVHKDKISLLTHIDLESYDSQTRQDIPITPAQWQQLESAVMALELKPMGKSFLSNLLQYMKQDGTDYRTLTLIWETGRGTKEVTYRWPNTPQADALEKLLVQLAEENK